MKQLEGIKKEIQHLLIVIDTSNQISRKTISNIQKSITDYIDSLTISKNIDYRLTIFTNKINKTSLLDELSNYLSKNSDGGAMPDFRNRSPIIAYISDKALFLSFFKCRLNQLKNQWWFRNSLKYGIAIGGNPKTSILLKRVLTGKSEVISANLRDLNDILNAIIRLGLLYNDHNRPCLDSVLFLNEKEE